MKVRIKLKCTGNSVPEGGKEASIRLEAVIDGSEENKDFFKYTPSGVVTFNTVNEHAAKQFEVGKEYYADFAPAK